MKTVVVVESPSKAKTINKYLGKDYTVLASFGHVRDLPTKDGSVNPAENFAMVWEADERGRKQVKEIEKALKSADQLYLATDPDREGEAISWHVLDMLSKSKALGSKPAKRIVFNEITKSAVKKAIENPRDLDQDLIEAYLARRALDYLVGFTLSPILWRKLPGSRSAGRVQSVALRLITDREAEIDLFKSEEYWSVQGLFGVTKGGFTARLTHYAGEKLDKLSIKNEKQALEVTTALQSASYGIESVEKKRTRRHPAPPFTTSTLQQEASRKLRFSARQTMTTAQKLYEGVSVNGETIGLITYMRTDSVSMSGEALTQTRDLIPKSFGAQYLPEKPNFYKTKSKNAQEAHECIRPTSFHRTPQEMRPFLDDGQFKLYDLVWKRAMASQMTSAEFDQTAIDVQSQQGGHTFRATGSILIFDGFLKLYMEDQDDQLDDDGEARLPSVSEGEEAILKEIEKEQHFTQPPPRYTEASLVKKLEELGIGRPSTYASIINTLQDRGYVVLDKRRFTPQPRGRIVTSFLKNYFPKYVEFDFTANLEDQLDEISNGKLVWLNVLGEFWSPFKSRTEEVVSFKNSDILDKLNDELGPLIFGTEPDARKCPKCDNGVLSIKNGKFGAFVGCSNYPECSYTRQFEEEDGGDEAAASKEDFPKLIGEDPTTGSPIELKKGPYGLYLEWTKDLNRLKKPKRASVPKGTPFSEVTLEKALALSSLPRALGVDPESGDEITASIGPYGPYIKHGSKFISLKNHDVLKVTLEEALEVIEEYKKNPPKPRGKKTKPKGKTKKK